MTARELREFCSASRWIDKLCERWLPDDLEVRELTKQCQASRARIEGRLVELRAMRSELLRCAKRRSKERRSKD